jgi:carbamoyl-phosphate synthase large subunit
VIPCRDDDVEWLARFRLRHGDRGSGYLCGAPQPVEIANDKWASHAFCLQHGLPFVPSLPGTPVPVDRARVDAFIARHGLPLVAKPRRGVDSRDVVLLHTTEQVHRALARPGTVVQQFLGKAADVEDYLAGVERDGIPLFHTFQGPKRSLQALIGPRGNLLHLVCTRNEMSGRNARTITLDADPDACAIGNRCAQVFAAAGWQGPLNVQCQPTSSGVLLIHEFNLRFTGATAARAWLGFDEIGAAVEAFTGRSLAPLPARAGATRSCEGLAARGANPRDVELLAASGEWAAARA